MALEDIERLKEKIEKDPDSKLFVPLAEEYKKAGMLDEAIDALSKGLERQPTYLSARVSLGKIYIEKDMLNEARDQFEKVTQVIPDNLYAHKKLAEIFRDLGEHEKAIYEFKTVLKLNPSDEWATSNLSTLEKGPAEAGLDISEEPPQDVPEELFTERDVELEPTEASLDISEEPPQDIPEELFTERDIELQPSQEPEIPEGEEDVPQSSPESAPAPEQEEPTPIQIPDEEEIAPLEELRTELEEEFKTLPEEPGPPSEEAADLWEIPSEDAEDTESAPQEETEPFSFERKEDLWGMEEKGPGLSLEDEEPQVPPTIEEEKNFWELSSQEDLEVIDDTEEALQVEFPESASIEPDTGIAAAEVVQEIDAAQAPTLQDADRFVSEEKYDEALKVYSELLRHDPDNKDLLQRVHELKSLLSLLGKDKEALIAKLEHLLEGLKKRRNEFFGNT